jgi:hypothetical protein
MEQFSFNINNKEDDEVDTLVKKSNNLNEEIQEVLDSFSQKISAPNESDSATTLIQLFDPTDQFYSNLTTIVVTYFNENNELPPPSILLEHYIDNISIPELEQILQSHINSKLQKWGLPLYVFNKIKSLNLKTDSKYDPLFVLACQKIVDQSSTKSFAARIKDLKPLGITEATWTSWMNIPSYFEYAKKLVDKQLETISDINANMGLARLIQKDDLQAIKYYHELTGRFKPALNDNQMNLQFMIITLLEILVKHVDPSIIDVIATELEDTPVGQLIKGEL